MKTIRFMRRVNLGNYEHEELDITIAIEDNACHIEASKKLKEDAEVALELRKADKKIADKKDFMTVSEYTGGKASSSVNPIVKKVKEVTGLSVKDIGGGMIEISPAKKVAKKKVAKKTAKKQPKMITYNRTTDHHKTAFTKLLGEVNADWKKSKETLTLAKEASLEMVGVDFMDASGVILDTFKTKVTELMSTDEV